jgi:hypothetical protein
MEEFLKFEIAKKLKKKGFKELCLAHYGNNGGFYSNAIDTYYRPNQDLDYIDGAEVWIVSWDRRFGAYHSDIARAAKAFLNKDDAKKFINNLEMAQDLLQNTHSINIVLEKQE